MKILITGVCGFVGSTLARTLPEYRSGLEILGLDNLGRAGSELNRRELQQRGIKFLHADIRQPSDLEDLPPVDFVIDAAANPSVLAGVAGAGGSRQLVEHNCYGTVNLLEYCRKFGAGFSMLSTSRVYSIEGLSRLPLSVADEKFVPDKSQAWPVGFSEQGISEEYSTVAPVSLYGATKLASEALAWNMAVRSISLSGLTAAAYWPGPDSLVALIRGSSATGFTRGAIACRSSTWDLGVMGIRCETVCSLGIWCR